MLNILTDYSLVCGAEGPDLVPHPLQSLVHDYDCHAIGERYLYRILGILRCVLTQYYLQLLHGCVRECCNAAFGASRTPWFSRWGGGFDV